MISSLLTFLVVGVIAIAVLGVALSVVGLAVGLAFKLLPLVLVGYVAVRLLSGKRNKKSISEADRRWLES